MAKILVVDDSMDMLIIFRHALEMDGHEVATASDHYQLKDYLNYEIPDLIVLDVLLSGANGRVLCKELKDTGYSKEIDVVLLSASPAMLVDYEDCGATDVIEKPFELDEMLAKLNRILKHRRSITGAVG